MKRLAADTWLAGADGCPKGWLVAFGSVDGQVKPPRIIETFADIVRSDERPSLIAIDVPIGLPGQSPLKGRHAESAVRPLLGRRASSVFRIPSREAVYASVAPEPANDLERFRLACEIARKTSDDNRAFSIQGFYICKKIVEVDQFLSAHADYVNHVIETHPEVAFWRMNGNAELSLPKKIRNRVNPAGLELRRKLLLRANFPEAVVRMKAPKGSADDDLIDALACLNTARYHYREESRPYPDPPPGRDGHGLPMVIWA